MHPSRAVLLLTFLVPPFRMLHAGYQAPAGGPTADAPVLLFLAVPMTCAGFHVLVQSPAGLLGSGRAGAARRWSGTAALSPSRAC
ncbi:hypothetical protein [Streptomyces poriticola]|uniref:hypothetical protein n=1 Tax=Streptomyces poriticola TaxID=3120506 RepID=UPI002FCE0753